MLQKLKLLLGISLEDDTQDALLELLIDMNTQEALSFCNLSQYSSKLEIVILKMCVQSYNRMGSEGATGESFSGISQSYVDGFSDDIKSLLKRFRRIRTLD